MEQGGRESLYEEDGSQQGPSQPLRALTSPLYIFPHLPARALICTRYDAWGPACPYRSDKEVSSG
jgi:hypothetical protein